MNITKQRKKNQGMLVSWVKSTRHAFSSQKKLLNIETTSLYDTDDLKKLVADFEDKKNDQTAAKSTPKEKNTDNKLTEPIHEKPKLSDDETNDFVCVTPNIKMNEINVGYKTPEPLSCIQKHQEAERRHFAALQNAENEAARQAELLARQEMAAVLAQTVISRVIHEQKACIPPSPAKSPKPEIKRRKPPVGIAMQNDNAVRTKMKRKSPLPPRLRRRSTSKATASLIPSRIAEESTKTNTDEKNTRRKSTKVVLTPRARAMAQVAQDGGIVREEASIVDEEIKLPEPITVIDDSDDEGTWLDTHEPLAAGTNLEEEVLDDTKSVTTPREKRPKIDLQEEDIIERGRQIEPRNHKRSAPTSISPPPPEPDGFLLPFLIASGVDAPRAIRVAARLSDARCYNARVFITMIGPSLRAAGLRMNEIKNLRDNARIAICTLEAAGIETTDKNRLLPKLVNNKNDMQSAGTSSNSPNSCYPQRSSFSPPPRKILKPRMDPTEWAKEQKRRIASAKRRREIRLTE